MRFPPNLLATERWGVFRVVFIAQGCVPDFYCIQNVVPVEMFRMAKIFDGKHCLIKYIWNFRNTEIRNTGIWQRPAKICIDFKRFLLTNSNCQIKRLSTLRLLVSFFGCGLYETFMKRISKLMLYESFDLIRVLFYFSFIFKELLAKWTQLYILKTLWTK